MNMLKSKSKIKDIATTIRIAIISNITLEPYFSFLINKLFSHSFISVELVRISYSEFMLNNSVKQVARCNIVVVIPNFENFYSSIFNQTDFESKKTQELINQELNNYKYIYSLIRSVSTASIIWFGYEDYCFHLKNAVGTIPLLNMLVDKINLQLFEQKNTDVVFIDMKSIIASIGINNAYNLKNKYRWNSPYSQKTIDQICNEIYKQYFIMNGITKKCLILDCDNVLWGGIISEDKIEGLKLSKSGFGHPYYEFQQFVLSLYYRGVILAICSKNDLSDVLSIFHNHSEMILRKKHIACFQVNWNNKPDNIKKISEKLNISLDSMVFVDDSPLEIDTVQAILPEVTTILFKRDMDYNQFSCFSLKNNVTITDIEKRNETYQTNVFRDELKTKHDNYDDYIKSLEINTDIHEATSVEYNRISELTQRTNKCTNGNRYTVTKIKERIIFNTVKLYSVSVSDRFSDLGLVGTIEVEDNVLTLFSLSCRALGRDVEKEMIRFIKTKHQISSILYHFTGKNDAIETLLLKEFPNAKLIIC